MFLLFFYFYFFPLPKNPSSDFYRQTPPVKLKVVLTNPDCVGGAVLDMHKHWDFEIINKKKGVCMPGLML